MTTQKTALLELAAWMERHNIMIEPDLMSSKANPGEYFPTVGLHFANGDTAIEFRSVTAWILREKAEGL